MYISLCFPLRLRNVYCQKKCCKYIENIQYIIVSNSYVHVPFPVGVAKVCSAWFLTSLRSVRGGVGFGSQCKFLWLWSVMTASSTPRLWRLPTRRSRDRALTAALREPYCGPTATPPPLHLHLPHPPAYCCSHLSTARRDTQQQGACLHLPLPRLCLSPNLGILVRDCVCE